MHTIGSELFLTEDEAVGYFLAWRSVAAPGEIHRVIIVAVGSILMTPIVSTMPRTTTIDGGIHAFFVCEGHGGTGST